MYHHKVYMRCVSHSLDFEIVIHLTSARNRTIIMVAAVLWLLYPKYIQHWQKRHGVAPPTIQQREFALYAWHNMVKQDCRVKDMGNGASYIIARVMPTLLPTDPKISPYTPLFPLCLLNHGFWPVPDTNVAIQITFHRIPSSEFQYKIMCHIFILCYASTKPLALVIHQNPTRYYFHPCPMNPN
jgi:hypothetical protein